MSPIWVLVVFVLTGDGHSSQSVELARFSQAQQCYDAQESSQRAYYAYKDGAKSLTVLGYFCEKRDR